MWFYIPILYYPCNILGSYLLELRFHYEFGSNSLYNNHIRMIQIAVDVIKMYIQQSANYRAWFKKRGRSLMTNYFIGYDIYNLGVMWDFPFLYVYIKSLHKLCLDNSFNYKWWFKIISSKFTHLFIKHCMFIEYSDSC